MMDLVGIEKNFYEEIRGAKSTQDLLQVKARFLGKKGHLSALLQALATLPAEERPRVGERANELKERIEGECRLFLDRIRAAEQALKSKVEPIDVTLPGREFHPGRIHPITRILEEVEDIFVALGFDIFEGPEVESDYYNFEALNIPADHPARDMQDTFYISPQPPLNLRGGEKGGILLRTHTSPVQIHVMEKHKPPIRMIAPGVVYRRDSDVSHSPMFHQVEGLVVGEAVRFSDLKGTVSRFLELFFGKHRVRFRPSYFPFTEPSAEVDVWWDQSTSPEGALRGRLDPALPVEGATRAPKIGWLEVMGCGMVHPNVFRKVKLDPRKTTGFAFGLGIERLAMLKLGIPDIRLFFENDIRFLEQFR